MSLLIRCGTLSACLVCLSATAFAQGGPRTLSVTREGQSDLRAVDLQIDQMIRSRDLRVRDTPQDELLPARRHERLDQYHRGVRIVGGDLTRQTAPDGTVSVFGVLHPTVGLSTDAALSRDAARSAIARAVGGQPTGELPELVVLPLSDGYHLAYRGQAINGIELVNVFVDANTGALLQQFSEFQTDGIVGKGTGTFGDDKKISVKAASGTFVADDGLRPAAITTYDMKGNLTRTMQVLNRLDECHRRRHRGRRRQRVDRSGRRRRPRLRRVVLRLPVQAIRAPRPRRPRPPHRGPDAPGASRRPADGAARKSSACITTTRSSAAPADRTAAAPLCSARACRAATSATSR